MVTLGWSELEFPGPVTLLSHIAPVFTQGKFTKISLNSKTNCASTMGTGGMRDGEARGPTVQAI